MAAKNKSAHILLKRGLRYLIERIIDSVQSDPFVEATFCEYLVNKILQHHDPKIAEQCQTQGRSLIHFYFDDLICNQHFSHFTLSAQYTSCQNCRCHLRTPILCRTFFLDNTKSPAGVIDVQDTINQGVPKWFSTSPISLKHLAWLKVLHLMQPFWKSRMSANRYHIHEVITLWDLLLTQFHWTYPVGYVLIDPLLLLPSYNEPGLNSSSWDLVTSFSKSSLVGVDEPFSSGAKMWVYLSFLAIYRKFPRSMDSDNLLWELSNVIDNLISPGLTIYANVTVKFST